MGQTLLPKATYTTLYTYLATWHVNNRCSTISNSQQNIHFALPSHPFFKHFLFSELHFWKPTKERILLLEESLQTSPSVPMHKAYKFSQNHQHLSLTNVIDKNMNNYDTKPLSTHSPKKWMLMFSFTYLVKLSNFWLIYMPNSLEWRY